MLENHLIITTFQGSCVRYACHLGCWDSFEEIENK